MENFMKRNRMLAEVMGSAEEPEHFHQDVELIYVLEGEMKLQICERKFALSGNDIVVINSNERHSLRASEGMLFVRVSIAYHLIRPACNGISSILLCNSSDGPSNGGGREYEELRGALRRMLMSQLVASQDERVGRKAGYGYLANYFHLLEELSAHFLVSTSSGEGLPQEQRLAQRMTQIHDYIFGNYTHPISLQSLAEHLHLSEGYLSRYFKSCFHMNFTDYLKQVRLSNALEDLLYTDRNITTIAYDNGFSSVPFFNKVFKAEYGRTPSSFREAHSKRGEVPGCLEDHAVQERLKDFLQKGNGNGGRGCQADRGQSRCPVEPSERLRPIWGQIMNISSAAELLRDEIREHVTLLNRSLHFKYARFWSIFSKEMMIDIKGREYNFSKMDKVVDFILSQGLKPFIDLEEKAWRVNVSPTSTLTYEDNEIEFEHIAQWEGMIEALLRHFVKRYGAEEVSKWKLEVWYGGYVLKGRGVRESYFPIFKSTKAIAARYAPGMEVGGCGMFPEYRSSQEIRERDFWGEWAHQGILPDFVSLMNYAYEVDLLEAPRYGRRSADEGFLLHGIHRLKEAMEAAGMMHIPIYITEWNLTISDRNCMNDTCFQGAYVAKSMIDAYGEVGMLGYFAGSDRTSEYYDSTQLLHGGQGLLTKDGIFKPSAFAMEFFHRLHSHFISKSDNYLVTADGRGDYAILCHNMRKLSYYYYLMEEGTVERKNIWKCFEDRNVLELDICLEGVEDGEYLMKVQKVNERSGSVLDVWMEMDCQPELSREDIKYFRRVCEPRLAIRKCRAEDHCLTLHMVMEPNEVALIRLEKGML